MAGTVVSVLSFICGTTICDCIDRHISFDDDVSKLKRKFQNLKRQKEEIESKKREQEQTGKVVKQEVTDWLKNVEDICGQVEAALEEAESFNWHKRYFVSKLVCNKITVVEGMLEEGSFPEGLVVKRAPAHGKTISTGNLVGQVSTKEQIWGYLMDDEVGMIGVCGIGGVGKTTIMKKVHDELQNETRFQQVIWVAVSHPLNVFELQEKIAKKMGESFREDVEDEMRAAALMDIMGGVRFVLILDDVWENFSLMDVGIPDPKVHKGCKVVVTSRSIEVCDYLFCEIVKVQPLSKEKSLELFLNTVGHGVLRVPRLEGILKLIVEECADLPLVIIVIAERMRGKYDVNEWENTLIELKDRVRSVNGWEDKIFARLRFSFDRLDDLQIKKCFLYCSLFREDYEFSRGELIEGWIDDGLIDIDDLGSRQKAYYRGHALLEKLVRKCLIEKTVEYILGDYEDVFKMHDVMRDMAIKIIGPEFGYVVKNLIAGQKVYAWPKDFSELSLMGIRFSKLPVGLPLKSPILSTLILSDNHLLEIPESLFEDMCALKVLDLSRTDIEALPYSICNLENLCTLRLRGCRRLTCLPSLGKLKALKKLDLRDAGIEVVPQGMEMLENLEYLDLFCYHLKEIPTGVLSKLSSLQYLALSYLGDTKKIPVEEVARLRKLEILQGRFEAIHELNSFVSESKNFQSFTAYGLQLGHMGADKWPFEGDYNRWLIIEHPEFDGEEQPESDGEEQRESDGEEQRESDGEEQPESDGEEQLEFDGEYVVLPANLEDLRIIGWEHMRRIMRSSLNKTVLLENATELRSCLIKDCEGIKYVVELDSSSSSLLNCPILDKLERLHLDSVHMLCALVRVEGITTRPRIFSNLKVLYITDCPGMRKLLPLELLRDLQNLEMIGVWNCEQMEEIIASSDKFTFPKLRRLTLSGLPQLKSICSDNGVMVCDSIKKIWIINCPELKRIPLQLPLLDNGQPSPPPHLREILINKESKEWWESVEWDHPNAKNVLQPFLKH